MIGFLPEIPWESQAGMPLLSLLVLLPGLGAVAVWAFRSDRAVRGFTHAVTAAVFILSLLLLLSFRPDVPDVQFAERVAWIPTLGISYHLGVDGISLLLVLLTTFLGVLLPFFPWTVAAGSTRTYAMTLLLLEALMVGVFLAMDLVLFFVFWELILIPTYFLIKLWGGARREYASLYFLLYALVGDLLILVGIVLLYLNRYEYAVAHALTPAYSADLLDLFQTPIPPDVQGWIFLCLALGFAVKVPLVPFHTWLPEAHVEAPTTGSVILAGILLKIGTYGFLRFCLALLPEASRAFMPTVLALAVLGIVYGGFLALAQQDMKRLIAYSSISHLGFVMLGLFSFDYQGLQGGLLQMINHGISTAGLFFIVGFLYERRHTQRISDLGGLAGRLPNLAFAYLLISLSSLAMPGTNGFVGEFLILVGAFHRHWVFAAAAVTGVVLGAIYLLWLYRRVMHGPPEAADRPENRALSDLTPSETVIAVALCTMVLWIGLAPGLFLSLTEGSLRRVAEVMAAAGGGGLP